LRIEDHPILGKPLRGAKITILFEGRLIEAYEGEPIAAALTAAGVRIFRYTQKRKEPRGISCALGRCTDCVMIVNGIPNTRTCVTPAENGMRVETQEGLGHRSDAE
jgi:aerobic-type carbon monoxide dehydrogenase small subunit (CoxS/CutS family)